jgi:hypothetical protein
MSVVSSPESTAYTDETFQLMDYTPNSDQSYLDILQQSFGTEWGDLARWRNKHVQRPHFDPRDAKQFRAAGVPAACFHTALVSLVLEPGVSVPASLEGDYAVVSQFRRKKMVEYAHEAMGRELYDRGAVLRCGFTSGELHARVYSKKFCHVFVPTARS